MQLAWQQKVLANYFLWCNKWLGCSYVIAKQYANSSDTIYRAVHESLDAVKFLNNPAANTNSKKINKPPIPKNIEF